MRYKVLNLAAYPPLTFSSNYEDILRSCPTLDLAIFEYSRYMLAHVPLGTAEDGCHLYIGRPNRIRAKV